MDRSLRHVSVDSGRDARNIRRPVIGRKPRNTVIAKLFIEEYITTLYYLAQLRNPNKITLTHQRIPNQSTR
jgi:hypothetical protein